MRKHLYTTHGHMDAVKYLIYQGANVECNDEDGLTLLHYASSKGYIDLIQLLIKHGAIVNVMDAAYRSI